MKAIDIARTTLRRILAGAGVKSPRRRRPPQHRVRRQRMPREGMLIQVDGSHHRWLGHHVSSFALLLAVDDATGIVVNALFCEQENTRDYFLLMRGLLQRYGIPVASTRPALRLQERARVRTRPCSHTVQSCDGRAGNTDGLRPVAAGQG